MRRARAAAGSPTGAVGGEWAPGAKLRRRDVDDLKIREDSEVALPQHPLGAIRPNALSHLGQKRRIGSQRPAIERRLLDRPVDGVSMVEVEAALPLTLGRIFFGETGIRGRNRRALLQDVDIGGVGGAEMVVIQPILELQLPVGVEGVGDFAGHDLELSGRALVDDEIEKPPGLAKKLVERRNIGGKAGKDEPAIAVEPRHPDQVVIGLIETGRILTGGAFGNRDIATAAIIRPGVVAADMQFAVSAPERAHQGAAVAAGVEDADDLVVLVP
jgi:hypothetical protein